MSAKWVAILVGLFSLTSTSKAITITVDDVIDVPNSFGYTIQWQHAPTGVYVPDMITQQIFKDRPFLDQDGRTYNLSLVLQTFEYEIIVDGVLIGHRVGTYMGYTANVVGDNSSGHSTVVDFFFPPGPTYHFSVATQINQHSGWEEVFVTPTADGFGAHIEYRLMPPLAWHHTPDGGGTASLLALGLIGFVYVRRYAVSVWQ